MLQRFLLHPRWGGKTFAGSKCWVSVFFFWGGELNKRLDDVIFDGLDKDLRDMMWMIVGKQCVEFDFWWARFCAG